MRSLAIQISGLIGIAVFLDHLWKNAALDQSIVVSVGVGVSVFLVYTIGHTLIKHIVALDPEKKENPEDARVTSETVAADSTASNATSSANA